MKLYALKSKDCYLKNEDGCILSVSVDKASVYPTREALSALINTAKQQGCDDLRCMLLEITETEIPFEC